MPHIFLPLDKVDKCHTCGGGGNLRLCGQCAERAYCSTICQKRDWSSHKVTCKTDRIDLTSYYPVLARIVDQSHFEVRTPHPAVGRKIINSPNPDTPAGLLPDGSSARIVLLGEPVEGEEMKDDLSGWWPTGYTAAVRAKLLRRIVREGNVLAITTATCLSLMLAMYSTTTTSVGVGGLRRVRLRYRSSPISDFGIVTGSARVTPEDQLAYFMPDKSIIKGQDPQDHYWIYFRTQKGEEVVLDCSMFTFNMCLIVQTHDYGCNSLQARLPEAIPALFKDRAMKRDMAYSATPDILLTERRRFSMLRDEGLRTAFKHVVIRPGGDLGISYDSLLVFTTFMSEVSGRVVSTAERDLLTRSLVTGFNVILDTAVRTDEWKRFPARPQVGIENDPGELEDL